MPYKLKDTKYTFYKRNGKDCYVWFEFRDYWREPIFKSSVHKISLNVYRMIKMEYGLRSNRVYI